MFGFRKRFELGLRLRPYSTGREPAHHAEHRESGTAVERPVDGWCSRDAAARRHVESGRVLFDPDARDAASATAICVRSSRAQNLPCARACCGSRRRSQAPATPPARPHRCHLPPTGPSASRCVKVRRQRVLAIARRSRATFALRLAESLVNRLVANGITLWRMRTGSIPALPAGWISTIGQPGAPLRKGWVIVEGSVPCRPGTIVTYRSRVSAVGHRIDLTLVAGCQRAPSVSVRERTNGSERLALRHLHERGPLARERRDVVAGGIGTEGFDGTCRRSVQRDRVLVQIRATERPQRRTLARVAGRSPFCASSAHLRIRRQHVPRSVFFVPMEDNHGAADGLRRSCAASEGPPTSRSPLQSSARFARRPVSADQRARRVDDASSARATVVSAAGQIGPRRSG